MAAPAAHGCSSCMLGAAHGCSSCMLGATIIRRPHATGHAPPMSPPTTWLTLYSLKTHSTTEHPVSRAAA